MYVERDRLQSDISRGVIVVEAGVKSGTMHTVRAARKQGKTIACCKYAEIAREGLYYIIDNDNDLENFIEYTFDTVKYSQININDFAL
jgi:hypothetical protein